MQAYFNFVSEELFIELEIWEDFLVIYQFYNVLGQAMQIQEQKFFKIIVCWDISQFRLGIYFMEV